MMVKRVLFALFVFFRFLIFRYLATTLRETGVFDLVLFPSRHFAVLSSAWPGDSTSTFLFRKRNKNFQNVIIGL